MATEKFLYCLSLSFFPLHYYYISKFSFVCFSLNFNYFSFALLQFSFHSYLLSGPVKLWRYHQTKFNIVCLFRNKKSMSGATWPAVVWFERAYSAQDLFFSRPSPKAGRELQTALDMMDDGPLASRSRSSGRESTQRLCSCFLLNCS